MPNSSLLGSSTYYSNLIQDKLRGTEKTKSQEVFFLRPFFLFVISLELVSLDDHNFASF